MADTTAAPNNKPVAFGKKVAAEPAGDGAMGGDGLAKPPRAPSGAAKSASIRKKAKGAINKGMISEKAAKKFLGNV